ncbi:MAG: hypothetical protein A3F17_06240 [Gammaproteobacteria bacterium RIFCSPHIGHO2_12_FULL_41_15]|nr:MAG: hypothetical protein A3F17_06240 [Gammaproteobacteria bacterium RIFCSPHIGHO2_12_FULL_41_15]
MAQKRCLHCRTRFTPLRNSHQRYCSKAACQKKRRANYQQQKLHNDHDYKEAHRTSQQTWRYSHPDYWRRYRLEHPAYVVANRVSQAKRDHKSEKNGLKAGHDFGLANMYLLTQINEYISNCYKVFLGKETALQICTL